MNPLGEAMAEMELMIRREKADLLLRLALEKAEAKSYAVCATVLRVAAGVFDEMAAESEAAK